MFVELSSRYDFLASSPLLGECFQTFLSSQNRNEETRQKNAATLMKFTDDSCRVFCLPSTEYLVGIEDRTRRPCWPLKNYIGSRIQFNPGYFKNDLRMRKEEERIMEGWVAKVAEDVQISIDHYDASFLWPFYEWDESLKKLATDPNSPSEEQKCLVRKKLPEFRRMITFDEDFVRSQYRWMRPFGYPQADKISPQWLLFRTVQTLLLTHLNLIEKNGANAHKMTDRNTTHEWLDYQYCLLAAQIGALATGESSQKERFLQIYPNGLVLFYDHKTQIVTETHTR